jgi:stringent starvation protein B
MSDASTKPYLIRAIHEWCSDNGFTPYLAVAVDQTTQVPREYVRGGEIVLNVSLEATHKLQLGNDYVEFQARFGGQARDIVIPIANVSAIYARENGHGMSFEVAKPLGIVESGADGGEAGSEHGSDGSSKAGAGGDNGVGANNGARGANGMGSGAGQGTQRGSDSRSGAARRGSGSGAPALSSVKPSSAVKSADSGQIGAKRPAARKLKSVSTGDGSNLASERGNTHDAAQVVSMSPESTSESSKSKVDHLASESGAASESQEATRTSSAPGPVLEPQTQAQPSKNSDGEPATDPTPDPTKPTSGKPTLTRVK